MSALLTQPLNPTSVTDGTGVELGSVGTPQMPDTKADVEIIATRSKERFLCLALFFIILVPALTIATVVINEWLTTPSQRGWLILGFGFYILTGLKTCSHAFQQAYERMFYLRVELRRLANKTLYDAVGHRIADLAEKEPYTCSRDQEATQEHDPQTGVLSVKLCFWGSQERTVRVCLNETDRATTSLLPRKKGLTAYVEYSPGENIVYGREGRLERQDKFVFVVPTTEQRVLKDKELLRSWFETCYAKWVEPVEGLVKIYGLQETSRDWMQTWEFERAKHCKDTAAKGQSFYLERESLQTVLADAKLWSDSALRVFLITGPPGVGKSEFTIWLASQLQLPVYRLCLSSPRMTDESLAQLLSQSAIKHDSVLVQVDEFQETVQRWVRSAKAIEGGSPGPGVTPGGFCECLQGSTAMGKGVVVLTGTGEVLQDSVKELLPAVFRRIHRETHLGWMSQVDIASYFRNFLAKFIPDSETEVQWHYWEQEFLKDPWTSRDISVDMLKQFLMHEITEASCLEYGTFVQGLVRDRTKFQIQRTRRSEFLRLVCDAQKATLFLDGYAPVSSA